MPASTHRPFDRGGLTGGVVRGLLVVLVFGSSSLNAQPLGPGGAEVTAASLRAEALYGLDAGTVEAVPQRAVRQRSVPLAFGFSALVPGLGQAYNRQWVKAAISLTVEAALLTGYVVWRRDGLDGEAAYQAFAHRDWDPARYATWLNDYKAYLNDNNFAVVTADDIAIPSGIDFAHPEGWSSADRQGADAFFNQIRALERQATHPETGASFSHVLPYFGEQQYYELIGKYFQFAPGWTDYPAWVEADGSFNVAIDPERTGAGGSKPNVSPTFYTYARDHADANDLLRRASRLSTLFIVNHLIAGIDAAVTAKLRNDRVDPSFGFSYGPGGKPQPTALLKLRW